MLIKYISCNGGSKHGLGGMKNARSNVHYPLL